MKKLLIVVTVFVLIFILGPVPVSASNGEMPALQTEQLPPSVLQASPSTLQVTQQSSSEYVLPYPGILPDHPLYTLKNFRDSILELLISDPARKIDFYILQSDKEISAAQLLSVNGKNAYVKQTVEHATVYKEKALLQAKAIKSQGKEVPSFLIERLTHSIQKQNDIIIELVQNSDADTKKILQLQQEKLHALIADIDSLKK